MILDTNAVSAILAGDANVATVLAATDQHHLTWIVLGEYRYGILGSRNRKKLTRLLDQLQSESRLIFPDHDTIEAYASVRAKLKRDGRPIPENDVWIAAVAVQYALPIVSTDSHFDYVEGITRLDW